MGRPVDSTGPVDYGYRYPITERLRSDVDIATMAVGLIVHADEASCRQGKRILSLNAQELLYNPNWPMDAAQKLGVDVDFASVPDAQAYCSPSARRGLTACHTFDLRCRPDSRPRQITIRLTRGKALRLHCPALEYPCWRHPDRNYLKKENPICWKLEPKPQTSSSRNHEMQDVSLADYRGKWVVLHTFPFAFTGG